MSLSVEAAISGENKWKRTIDVVVPATEVDGAIKTATERVRKAAKIPGFRPGKVPASLIRERFGDDIRQDALEHLLPLAYDAALQKLELIPIGSPTLSKVKFEPGTDMSFVVEIEIRPQVEIAGYKGLKLEKKVYEITDNDIDIAIDSLRDNLATTSPVEREARAGDVVVCDLQRIRDSLDKVKKDKFEDVTFDLREDRTRPEFLTGIVGMKIGEGKEIEVTYSSSDPDPDLAGNTVLFRAWLKSVSQKVLPAVDDEFAKKIGNFDSVAKLREFISADLKRRTESTSLKEMGQDARRQIIEANTFDVPEGLLNEYLGGVFDRLKQANPGVTEEAVRKQFEPMAIEQFRWDYTIFEIAKKEGLEVTDEEVKAVQETWPPDAKEAPSEEKIRESLLENKVYEFVVSEAEVTEVPRVINPRIVTPSSPDPA